MTRSTPNHVAVRHIPAIIETITPLIRKVDGGCMWVNPSHSDARVAEIVSGQLGITVTKGNMRHIRDDCFGPIIKRGSVDELAELTDRVMTLEHTVLSLQLVIEQSMNLGQNVGINWGAITPNSIDRPVTSDAAE